MLFPVTHWLRLPELACSGAKCVELQTPASALTTTFEMRISGMCIVSVKLCFEASNPAVEIGVYSLNILHIFQKTAKFFIS